ncbi:MAG: DUF2459 domain-containing protein [Gammaproteobacteria bacterium]|nr:MAG: DUF2459 domain-containing protein [Gammaproteobacteria bacterium]
MPRNQDIPVANTKHTIYFIYRGWHTSVLVEAKILATQIPKLAPDLKNQKYARVGWGDGDYFTGKNKSVSAAAKALVASGYSAVQLLPYDYEPFTEIPTETIVPLAVTDQGLHQLLVYLGNSIAVDDQGELIRLPAFGDAMGSFFRSKSSYGIFSNCNTWSGNALRAAGLPVANRLTAQGVFDQARFISKIQSEHGLFKKQP